MRSVAVVFRLVGTFLLDADIGSLFIRKHGKLSIEVGELQTGNFFVKVFRKNVDPTGYLS